MGVVWCSLTRVWKRRNNYLIVARSCVCRVNIKKKRVYWLRICTRNAAVPDVRFNLFIIKHFKKEFHLHCILSSVLWTQKADCMYLGGLVAS